MRQSVAPDGFAFRENFFEKPDGLEKLKPVRLFGKFLI